MYLILIAISFFIFRSILLSPATHLLDWNDYPLYVWIIFQNIFHLKNLDLANIFNGNIFYPLSGTLLFSDLLLPQTLIALPINLFIKNPVLVFNLVFSITLVLNVLAVTFFWKNFTKNKLETFFASLLTLFSAFMFVNRVHFQIFSIWPFFFGLGYLFKKKSLKNISLLALWTIIQFYSGVYLGVFMIFIVGLYYLWELVLVYKNKTKIINFLRYSSLFLGFLILFVGPLFLAYLNVRVQYNAKRNYQEYVSYSADLTDYIFPTHLSSVLGRTKTMKKWSSYGHRAGIFPGIVTLSLALGGLLRVISVRKKSKDIKLLAIDLNKFSLFFLSLIIIGFVFSLGPRLNVNGQYLRIPLPYHLVMKFNPLFEVIRVPYRWSLLLFIGLIYFAILGIQKLKKNQIIIVILLSFLFILELIPLKLTSEEKSYFPKVYQTIIGNCQNKVLLEYPMTQFKKDANIITNLTYRTQMILASTRHSCSLINGYSGYIPQEYTAYENSFFRSVENNQKDLFFKLFQQKNIDFFKLNKKELFSDRAQKIEVWLTTNPAFNILYNDKNYLVVKLK